MLERWKDTWIVKAGADAVQAVITEGGVAGRRCGPPTVTTRLEAVSGYRKIQRCAGSISTREGARSSDGDAPLSRGTGQSLSSVGTRRQQTSIGELICGSATASARTPASSTGRHSRHARLRHDAAHVRRHRDGGAVTTVRSSWCRSRAGDPRGRSRSLARGRRPSSAASPGRRPASSSTAQIARRRSTASSRGGSPLQRRARARAPVRARSRGAARRVGQGERPSSARGRQFASRRCCSCGPSPSHLARTGGFDALDVDRRQCTRISGRSWRHLSAAPLPRCSGRPAPSTRRRCRVSPMPPRFVRRTRATRKRLTSTAGSVSVDRRRRGSRRCRLSVGPDLGPRRAPSAGRAQSKTARNGELRRDVVFAARHIDAPFDGPGRRADCPRAGRRR